MFSTNLGPSEVVLQRLLITQELNEQKMSMSYQKTIQKHKDFYDLKALARKKIWFIFS